jgi:hypothetical protein
MLTALLGLLALAPQEAVGVLVQSLGSEDPTTREQAKRRLKEVGEPALSTLDRARHHEDIEVRSRAAEVAREIRSLLKTHVQTSRLLAQVREAGDADLPFAKERPVLQRRVPRRAVGEAIELSEGREVLSREAAGALERGPVVLDGEGKDVDVALSKEPWVPRNRIVLLALSAKAYLILQLDLRYDPSRYRSRILAAGRTGEVWGIDSDEADWWLKHLHLILERDLELEPAPGGGLRVKSLRPGSSAAVRGFREGDLILKADDVAVSSREDLDRQWRQGWAALRQIPPSGPGPRFRLDLLRGGAPAGLHFMWLP